MQTGNRDPAPRDRSSDAHEPDRRRGALIGLVVVVLLVLGGLVLARVLRNMSRVQDCVMAGHTNCAPITTQ